MCNTDRNIHRHTDRNMDGQSQRQKETDREIECVIQMERVTHPQTYKQRVDKKEKTRGQIRTHDSDLFSK